MSSQLLAAVEGGGTSFVVTIALLRPSELKGTTIEHTAFEILHQETIPSVIPSDTLANVCKFFKKHSPENGYDALGVACFGPLGVNEDDPATYGKILPGSPKKDWRNIDILSPILLACSSFDGKKKPLYKVDTDVNAPAMAEFDYIQNTPMKKITSLAYVTVGTGIGVGLVVNHKPVHGMMHPEGGHVPIAPLSGEDFSYSWGDKSPFRGKNTVEGTASSVALTERHCGTTTKPSDKIGEAEQRDALKNLTDEDPVWDHAANALANLCVTLALTMSVEKIVFGGGVMNRNVLYSKTRERTRELLNGYLDLPQLTTDEGLKEYIGPSVWSDVGPGLVGALVLAKLAYEEGSMNDTMMTNDVSDHSKSICAATKCPLNAKNARTFAYCTGIFVLGLIIGRKKR